jgi:hypothetical protein
MDDELLTTTGIRQRYRSQFEATARAILEAAVKCPASAHHLWIQNCIWAECPWLSLSEIEEIMEQADISYDGTEIRISYQRPNAPINIIVKIV